MNMRTLLRFAVEATDFKAKYELTTPAQFNLYWFLFTFVPNYWLAVAEKEKKK